MAVYPNGYPSVLQGMAECLAAWGKHNDPACIAKLQADLISVYEHDFTKYNRRINVARSLMVCRSIAPQLAKENENHLRRRQARSTRS